MISRPPSGSSLLKFSEQDMNTFLGYCQAIKAINLGNAAHTKVLKEKAVELIEIIKSEYSLK